MNEQTPTGRYQHKSFGVQIPINITPEIKDRARESLKMLQKSVESRINDLLFRNIDLKQHESRILRQRCIDAIMSINPDWYKIPHGSRKEPVRYKIRRWERMARSATRRRFK